MEQLKKIAQQYASEFRTINANDEYADNIVFLGYLEEAYVISEHYEIASIINSRIKILESKNELNLTMDNFRGKVQKYFLEIRDEATVTLGIEKKKTTT